MVENEELLGPDHYDLTEDEIDEILNDLYSYQEFLKLNYETGLKKYLEISSEFTKHDDWEDFYEEMLNPENYFEIKSVGFCTVRQEGKTYVVDNLELEHNMSAEGLTHEESPFRFKKQKFLEGCPDMLIYQRTGFLEDDYYGYMLLPVYNSEKYWILNYDC